MNEWKELKIDNLPPDILKGDYEFEVWVNSYWDKKNPSFPRWSVIRHLQDRGEWRYRKPEPKAPSHEEIMTKWWRLDNKTWSKVTGYITVSERLKELKYDYRIYNTWYQIDWFTGRKSADIPQEE